MKRRLYTIYRQTERLKTWFSWRFTPLGKIFVLIFFLAAIFGLNVQRTMIYQIFALTAVLLAAAIIGSLRFTTGLNVRRVLPGSCVAGSRLHYRVVLENRGLKTIRSIYYRELLKENLPTWEEFSGTREEGEERRNFFDRKMGYYRWLWLIREERRLEVDNQVLPELAPGRSCEVEVSLLPLKRGNIHFNGYVLGKADPFGLCHGETGRKDECNLLILPKLYEVPQLFFQGGRKYHQGGITAAREQGDSNEFISLREYVHGDPIKHIDWKSTARTGRTIVKQYRDEYFSRFGLVLDSFTTHKYSRVFEEAVSVAASILMAQSNEDDILDLLFVGDECVTCTAGAGVAGYQRMLEILASVTTCCDRPFAELSGLVKSHAALFSGAIVLLIDLDDSRLQLIRHLLARKIPVKPLLLVENREEFLRKQSLPISAIALKIIEIGNVEKELAEL